MTANWIANNYTVNYYNGNTKVGSSSHTYNSAKSLTTTSVLNLNKTGYTFAGWSTTSGGTTVNYTDGASVTNLTSTHNGTVNLYAIWKANTSTSYSVNHYLMNTDGATYALNSTQNIQVHQMQPLHYLHIEKHLLDLRIKKQDLITHLPQPHPLLQQYLQMEVVSLTFIIQETNIK